MFIGQELNNVKVKITADPEDGKQVNTLVPIPFQLIAGGIKEYRKRLVSDIQSKAKANAIILDDDDLAIINAGEKS